MITGLKRDRVLIVFCALGLFAGAREYVVSRNGAATDWQTGCQASAASCFSIPSRAAPMEDTAFWSRHTRVTELVTRLNPGDPDTEFLQAMQALADGDRGEFSRRMDEAIASGVKHNDILLHFHAQYLLESGANWEEVNRAVNRWRRNHPFSAATLALRLADGPRTPADEAALRRALGEVPWLAGFDLERPTSGDPAWRVLFSFRPGRNVDLRQAVAAVTTLSIPEAQRSLYEVTCRTLRDCTASRRPGR